MAVTPRPSLAMTDPRAKSDNNRQRWHTELSTGRAISALDMQPYGSLFTVMNDEAVFRALADKSRRQLLDRLHIESGQTLGELCQGMEMTRQAVAKHLAILEEANLVATQRRGREKLHFINPVPINEIAERWIGKFERPRLSALSDLKKTLEGEHHAERRRK
jgi:DNA-binding transcriptional ArsR family regulator